MTGAEGECRILGVDIGGANIKYCTNDGQACSTNFPMWKLADQLVDALHQDCRRFTDIDSIAITMTGELADCFLDRAIGVQHIVSHACRAALKCGIRDLRFYGVDGQFHDATSANESVDRIAAANWHALASFIGQEFPNCTLVDIGSTTTDIIPIKHGIVGTSATTDYDRLREGMLVYVGCRRTPVCSLVNCLDHEGASIEVMNELFATVDDARLVLGREDEDRQDTDTADGQPRTIEFAANRLARMIGLDRRQVPIGDAKQLAEQILAAATQRISRIAGQHIQETVVLTGHGEDLLRLPEPVTRVFLRDHWGEQVVRSAPSYAVAHLYQRSLSVI